MGPSRERAVSPEQQHDDMPDDVFPEPALHEYEPQPDGPAAPSGRDLRRRPAVPQPAATNDGPVLRRVYVDLQRLQPSQSTRPACHDYTDADFPTADRPCLPARSSANHGAPPGPSAHSAPANQSPADAAPQPCRQPTPEPELGRGKRVRFAPQPLVVGDPTHPYWMQHHERPRIPSQRGGGR